MGDPRVQERDNPLVRRLNSVARVNEEMGTALGGGARPPRPPINAPVQGGSATVLPPPAVPLSPEEALQQLPEADQEELERRWAADPSNPANKNPQPQTAREFVDSRPPVAGIMDAHPLSRNPVVFRGDYLSMIDALPISEERKQTIRMWAFEGAAQEIMKETAARLDAMQAAFGLAPKEAKSEADVQGVQRGEGENTLQEASKDVPPVREPRARKARKGRKVQRKVARTRKDAPAEGGESA